MVAWILKEIFKSTDISCYGKFIPNTTAKLNEKFKKITYYYLYYKGHF